MQTTPAPQLMILLFSNFSTACKKLRQSLKDEHLSHFKPVCVDNEQIRGLLLESSNIQVERVPCLLHVFADGTVAKYEADDAFRWIANYISQLSKPQQQRTANPDGSLPTSSVSNLLGDIPPVQRSPQKAPTASIGGMQGKRAQQVRVSEVYPDLAPSSRRREPFQGLSSERDVGVTGMLRPARGEGHSGMMRSSLPEMQQGDEGDFVDYGDSNPPVLEQYQEQAPRRVQIGHGKQAKMIEDLTPEEEEEDDIDLDPSGMRGASRPETIPIMGKPESVNATPDRNQTMGSMGKRSGEKSSGIKNLASAIAAARETEDQKYEQARQGPVKTQRSNNKHTPISL